jgi:hypothetical protein
MCEETCNLIPGRPLHRAGQPLQSKERSPLQGRRVLLNSNGLEGTDYTPANIACGGTYANNTPLPAVQIIQAGLLPIKAQSVASAR